MRLFLFVLVLLNLLALASARGWLGTSTPRGEPERLTNQLNPDKIVLLQPAQPLDAPPLAELSAPAAQPEPQSTAATETAPAETPVAEAAAEKPPAIEPPLDSSAASPFAAAAPPMPACVAYAELTAAQADALAAAAGADLQVERRPTSAPTGWWVRIPPAGSREAAERKVAEVRTLGISDYYVVREPGPNQFSVSLGLFRTEAKARRHLAFLRNKGVAGAEVAARNGTAYRAEFRGPASQIEALQRTASAGAVAANRSECEL